VPFGLVDDRLHSHVKWRRATKGARALWATALSWCSSWPSDGYVPADMLRTLDGTVAEAECLVQVGLWEQLDDGWAFHQWSERNPDAESARAALAAKSEGGKAGNHRRWHTDRGIRVKGCILCFPNRSDNRSDSDRSSESLRTSHGIAPSPSPSQESSNELSSPSTAGAAEAFDRFWTTYPRRDDKGHAVKAFTAALRKADAESIIEGAHEFATTCEREHRERKFIPLAATWLNGERWADESTSDADPKPSADDYNNITALRLAGQLPERLPHMRAPERLRKTLRLGPVEPEADGR